MQFERQLELRTEETLAKQVIYDAVETRAIDPVRTVVRTRFLRNLSVVKQSLEALMQFERRRELRTAETLMRQATLVVAVGNEVNLFAYFLR